VNPAEVKRLVLTCKNLESQLAQSIPKKTHQEVVKKLQQMIDNGTRELDRLQKQLENIVTFGERINSLTTQLQTQNEVITESKKTIGELYGKFETMVSKDAYEEALSKARQFETRCDELEHQVSSMIPHEKYVTLEEKYDALQAQIGSMVPFAKYEELQKQISSMVPRDKYAAVEAICVEYQSKFAKMVTPEKYAAIELELSNSVPREKYEEVKRALAQSVPVEQYTTAEARIAELEKTLANSVPRSHFEELSTRIATLSQELETVQEATSYETEESGVQGIEESSKVESPPSLTTSSEVPTIAAQEEHQLGESESFHETQPEIGHAETSEIYIEAAAQEPTAEASTPAQVPSEVASASSVAPADTVAPVEENPVLVDDSTPAVAVAPQEFEINVAGAQTVADSTPVAAEIPAVQEIVAEAQPPQEEIREVQSQLSDIKSQSDSGAGSFTPTIVDADRGFKFLNTEYCAKSGTEFLEDLEQVDIETMEAHSKNGDFERWFADVLSDFQSAEALRTIRESNSSGEELRAQLIAVVAPRYKN
jgi:uncharacterized coiled-coil protein SlyX